MNSATTSKAGQVHWKEMLEECIVCSDRQYSMFSKGRFGYSRCCSCGLVTTNPIPSAQEIENHYRQKLQSGNYQLYLKDPSKYDRVYSGFVDKVKSVLALEGQNLLGQDILDIGCFAGGLLDLFRNEGANVFGIELQKEAVEIASQKLPGCIYQADLHSDQFPQGPFDIITLTGVIEHVIEPLGLVSRIFELLKPGGMTMIQTPNSGSLFAKLMGRHWPPYASVEHIYLFTKESLTRVLSDTGFEKIETSKHWKWLPSSYIYQNLENFGPEWQPICGPIYQILPERIKELPLPFYVGEIIITAKKP